LNERISRLFFKRVLLLAEWKELVSDEHFSVDGTLIQAWASMKSFVNKYGSSPHGGRNPTANFKGEKRSNDTHLCPWGMPRAPIQMLACTKRAKATRRNCVLSDTH